MNEVLEPQAEKSVISKRTRAWGILIFGLVLLLAAGFFASGKYQFSVNNIFGPAVSETPTATPDPDYAMPDKDPNRLNILIMGIRGENDPDASDGGPLLTDSIQVFSYDKTTKKSSLISIPRDLYIEITPEKKDKLNVAYEYGLAHSPDSLEFVRHKLSEITGVYINEVVIFDFSSFKEIVDALGGIDVTLAQPFSETQQWGYTFSLPAGPNHLDGQSALYYARSRYTSSDFDRSRRQQQIIFAIKDKLTKLNLLADPVKSFQILNLIRNDVKTTISLWSVKQYFDIAHTLKFDEMQRTIISTDNLLVEGRGPSNAYVLLPKGGSLSGIKELFQNSLK